MKFLVRGPAPRRVAALRRSLAQLALAALALAALPAAAQESLEASVKAAYLYKFLGYVDWPPQAFPAADTPQVIGIMGADDVLAEFQRLTAGRQVDGRSLVARKVVAGEGVEGLQVLYVGRAARPAAILPTLSGRPILSVTDAPSGLADGSALNFVLVQGRVRFEASLPAAERAGLKLSARLLAVAERVVTP